MPSDAVDVDHGQIVGRRLKDCPIVMDLHELSPIDRLATGRRDGRWFERLAEMCQDLPDRPRIGDEGDEPDVVTTPRALEPFGSGRQWVGGRDTVSTVELCLGGWRIGPN
jgi:hypothetical protein